MRATCIYTVFIAILLAISPNYIGYAQESTSNAPLDISNKHLDKLNGLQDFYRSELKKGTLTDEMVEEYRAVLKDIEAEIDEIKEKRLENARKVRNTDPAELEQEKLNNQFRELDLSIADESPPMVNAYELQSLFFNAGVSFLSLETYSAPFTISGEKAFNRNFSVGGYFGHFIEKVRDKTDYLDSNQYFASNKSNYKHTYYNFGIKGSYHYFNPSFILSPRLFDLYASVMLGYSITTAPHPFLNNEEYLPYDAEGDYQEPGQGKNAFLEPEKNGLNFGAFVGLRYMYDNNLGFYIEGGYSNTAFASIGATFRILDKRTGASPINPEEEKIFFNVQLFTSEKPKKPDSKSFKGLEGAKELKYKKEYIYYVSPEENTYEGAAVLQNDLNKFKRSEVIAIKNGKVIKLEKALKELGTNSEPNKLTKFFYNLFMKSDVEDEQEENETENDE